METVTDFIVLGFKITADGDCSHEIKRCLLLGRKAIAKIDSTLAFLHPVALAVVLETVFPHVPEVVLVDVADRKSVV